MSFITFTSTAGRSVEVQIKTLYIRTPGNPLPRDFTCAVTGDESLAIVELGATHKSDVKNHEIMTAIREVLGSLGFTKMKYTKDGRKVTVKTIRGKS